MDSFEAPHLPWFADGGLHTVSSGGLLCVCVCVCVCVCTSPKSLSVSKFPLLIRHQSYCTGGFLGGPMVKNLPAMQEIQV